MQDPLITCTQRIDRLFIVVIYDYASIVVQLFTFKLISARPR